MDIEYDLILYGKDEFFPNLSKKTYNILKVNNKKKEKYMSKIFNNFIENQNKNPDQKHYIGIDFEFNKVSKSDREVALMQINLENDSNKGNIFILFPPGLDKINLNVLIKLLTHKKIIKIFHGAESLDIPYLFNQLLITKENIDNFSINFYDTKYLCDYYYLENKTTGKCGIYNLLVDNNIISQTKMNELDKLADDIGPLYHINISINNLSNKLGNKIFKYSLYDVLYLPELIKKITDRGEIYANIIPEFSSIINKYKRGYDERIINLDKIINEYNNYYIINKKNKTNLKDIWEIYFYYLCDKNNYLDILKEINYFKSFIIIITKLFIYSHLIDNFVVFKNKDIKVTNNNFTKYFNIFSKYEEINKLLNEYNIIVKNEFKLLDKTI